MGERRGEGDEREEMREREREGERERERERRESGIEQRESKERGEVRRCFQNKRFYF